jgi:hypothetical protein
MISRPRTAWGVDGASIPHHRLFASLFQTDINRDQRIIIHLFGAFSQEKEGDLIDSRKINRAVEPPTELVGLRIDKHEGG